jgi:hypothetical protein
VPRRCSVCHHNRRDEIEAGLVTRADSFRHIAARYRVSTAALVRHKKAHLPATLLKAQEVKEVNSAQSLLEQIEGLQKKTLEILDTAVDQRTALLAVQQARANLQLLAELTGKLATQPVVQVAVVELPMLNRTTQQNTDGA